MGEIALHLTELGTQDWFVLITVSVNADGQALIRYGDYEARRANHHDCV
jgi:hypothetical protein